MKLLKLLIICSLCISCANEPQFNPKKSKADTDSIYNHQLDSINNYSGFQADSLIKWSDSITMYKIYQEHN